MNPRHQCTVCGKWKREHGFRISDRGQREMFYRFLGCGYGNGDHLAGDGSTVCEDCCQRECRKIAAARDAA